MQYLKFSALLVVTVLLLDNCLKAQNLHVDLIAGAANYQGDLQDKAFTLKQGHFAGGIGLSYDLTDRFSLRLGVLSGTISGNDQFGRNKIRNLNFTSEIIEANAGIEYYLTQFFGDHPLTPYVYLGVALFHFDPFTNDSLGNKYYLKPLSTEGEGFVTGKRNYNLTQLSVPLGGGVKFLLSDRISISAELIFRKLFTDYLDDVSDNYVDQSLLLANRGAKAVELAYRSGELKAGSPVYPEGGRKRGSVRNKDWYYFTGITFSFRLGRGAHQGIRHGSYLPYQCPGNVR